MYFGNGRDDKIVNIFARKSQISNTSGFLQNSRAKKGFSLSKGRKQGYKRNNDNLVANISVSPFFLTI